MKETIIHAIDIGTTKVAALAARRNEFGKIDIIGIGNSPSFGVARGVVVNIDKTVHAIRKAVEEAERQSGTKFTDVEVGIAGSHIKSMQNRGIHTRENSEDEISKADIDKLIQDMYKLSISPSDKILHILPQDFIVDTLRGVKDPVGMGGVRLEGNFHIITGEVVAIKNIMRCIERAELKVKNIILEPLASAAAVLSQEEMEAGVALVDIGGGTTDIAIFEDNIIRHTAVIPFGGNAITEDIKKGFLILREQAETLKVKFGCALPYESQEGELVSIPNPRGRDHKEVTVQNLAFIIKARMEEIMEAVQYEIKSSGYDQNLGSGIVLTGGGSQLKHLAHLASLVTGQDARLGAPNEHLQSSRMRDLSNPIYATGIGLAIRAFEELENKKELEEIKRKKAEGTYVAPELSESVTMSDDDKGNSRQLEIGDEVNTEEGKVKSASNADRIRAAGNKKTPKKGGVQNIFGKIINYLEGDFKDFD